MPFEQDSSTPHVSCAQAVPNLPKPSRLHECSARAVFVWISRARKSSSVVGSFFSDKEEDLSAYTLITITDSHSERIREQQHEGENNTGFMAPRLIRGLSPGIVFALFYVNQVSPHSWR